MRRIMPALPARREPAAPRPCRRKIPCMPMREFVADRGDGGVRLDLVIRRYLPDVRLATRTRVQVWMREARVAVNGVVVSRPAARAATGDRITIELPEAAPRAPMRPEPGRLHVLYEDAHFLAVEKAAGMVVHPTFRHPTGTLMNALLWHARNWPAPQRPSLVGRLDKLTSGIVLVARTRAVHASLQRALASPVSRKEYLALVYGKVTPSRGTIDLRLHRDDRDRRRVVASLSRGLASLTQYERLARVAAPRAGLALVRCRLLTGRMHQIRVHLAARGWPIVGDPVYGEPRWRAIEEARLAQRLAGFPRQALHAWRLAFPHPRTGAAIRIEASWPLDMRSLATEAGLQG